MIQRTGAAYKVQSGILSAATLDRAQNAITYRVFGCENERQNAYEKNLSDYERSAVKANIWNSIMPPVYRIISMTGVLFILYFGQKNVLGNGWKTWNIATFTTFLACFVKLSVKSSSAAKLFNAVHKATGILESYSFSAESCAETVRRSCATGRKTGGKSAKLCLSGWQENI